MQVEFDPDKDRENFLKHGLALSRASELDLETASVIVDDRQDYGEARFRAFGRIDGRLYMLAFTMREEWLRAISFRKANAREEKRYGR